MRREYLVPIYEKKIVGYRKVTDKRSLGRFVNDRAIVAFFVDNKEMLPFALSGSWKEKTYLTPSARELLMLAQRKFDYSDGYCFNGDLWSRLKRLYESPWVQDILKLTDQPN